MVLNFASAKNPGRLAAGGRCVHVASRWRLPVGRAGSRGVAGAGLGALSLPGALQG